MAGFLARLFATSALACACVAGAQEARASSPYLEAPDPAVAMRSPAYRYANMTDDEAYAELSRRSILFTREKPTTGVRAPVRLTGRLHGVLIRSSLPPEERATTMFEICDARLALAIDDFSAVLAKHDVEELVHYTMYRPNMPAPGEAVATKSTDVPGPAVKKKGKRRALIAKGHVPSKGQTPKSRGAGKKSGVADSFDEEDAVEKLDVPRASFDLAEDGHDHAHDHDHDVALDIDGPADDAVIATDGRGAKVAPRKPSPQRGRKTAKATPGRERFVVPNEHVHGRWAPPGTRHPAGLAIDVGSLKKRDGSVLSISQHFDGKIGQRTCGVGAAEPIAKEAKELRAIVCEARDLGIFTYTLTPNYDRAHADHLHMEIKPGVTWFLYH